MTTLDEVAENLSMRLTRLFLLDENQRRHICGNAETFQRDPL
jgi:hypothetical protein